MSKRAIVVVSFGTAYREALDSAIFVVENKIRERFPDYEVKRAFTSRRVIKILADRDGLEVDTELEALKRLQRENYRDVIIQPLHVVAGAEYEKLKCSVCRYLQQEKGAFDHVSLGRPLLYFTGNGGAVDDYTQLIQALTKTSSTLPNDEAVVLMGHGGMHPGNTAYAALQLKFDAAGLARYFVYALEGFPSLEFVMEQLKEQQIKSVRLLPLVLTSGNHVKHDLDGAEANSARSRLEKAGFRVTVNLQGLGEKEAIQELYIQHLQDAISQSCEYKN